MYVILLPSSKNVGWYSTRWVRREEMKHCAEWEVVHVSKRMKNKISVLHVRIELTTSGL